MKISGSCSCGAVRFSAQSKHPVPYMRCYCSICVKTSGGGGYAINTAADAESLEVTGREYLKTYQAMVERGGKLVRSQHERHFCGECGSHLWASHSKWPHLIHPVAGGLDGEVPIPECSVHMMLGSKPSWVIPEGRGDDRKFQEYPEQSIANFHDEHGWTRE